MTSINKCNENNCQCGQESKPMLVTDAAGREKWWEDAGRPE
jgi:hypothetical protein